MIKLIRQLIRDFKSSGNFGKGSKYYRSGDYERALHHYELATQYANSSFFNIPLPLEYLAMTHAQMGNIGQALAAAEGVLKLYRETGGTEKPFAEGINRMEYFIALLKSNNEEDIKNYLSNH